MDWSHNMCVDLHREAIQTGAIYASLIHVHSSTGRGEIVLLLGGETAKSVSYFLNKILFTKIVSLKTNNRRQRIYYSMFTPSFQPMNYLKICQLFHKIRAYCLCTIFFEYSLCFSSNKYIPHPQTILSHLLQLWLQLWQTSRTIYSASFKATQNQQAT